MLTPHGECKFGLRGRGAGLGFPFFLKLPSPPEMFCISPGRVEHSGPYFAWLGSPLDPELCEQLSSSSLSYERGELRLYLRPLWARCPWPWPLGSAICHSGPLGYQLTVYRSSSYIFSFSAPKDFLFFPLGSIMYLIILYYILPSISMHLELGVVMAGTVCICSDLLFRIFTSRMTSKISLWFYFCFIFGRFWYQGYVLFIKLIRKFSSFLYPLEHFK